MTHISKKQTGVNQTRRFPTQEILEEYRNLKQARMHSLATKEGKISWGDSRDRYTILMSGVAYQYIEALSGSTQIPINKLLTLMGIKQTTYNKKVREKGVLSMKDGEHLLMIQELDDYGREVFNHENEKYNRWLQKPNISLGGVSPISMLNSSTGIYEVKGCLDRINYGTMA